MADNDISGPPPPDLGAGDPPRLRPFNEERDLAFDIAFALPRAGIRGLRRAFTEDERYRIGRQIVSHLKLCGWRFDRDPPAVGHGTRSAITNDDPKSQQG